MHLAEHLKMTVTRLLDEMSETEFNYWRALMQSRNKG
jgi:hypothetical protein